MMFSFSFVGGSMSASRFGPGGPNLGGSKSAGTPAFDYVTSKIHYE